ncbi:MAG: hypothetical protein WA142_04140 [Rugosibacter sp.]
MIQIALRVGFGKTIPAEGFRLPLAQPDYRAIALVIQLFKT